jgi:hypothetical protein
MKKIKAYMNNYECWKSFAMLVYISFPTRSVQSRALSQNVN